MKLTVQDIANFSILDKATLIAGQGGLIKPVLHCGILDYEYDKDVSSKYYDYNYQMDGFLTLTTFLYAKNDPNLIYDAVKKLVSKKGSGLIIKNIFKLPISDKVIKYANRMDFPIFILNDSYPFFEDIIVAINKAIELYDSVYFTENKVKRLLSTHEDDRHTVSKLIYDINPSMHDNFICLRFKYKHGHYAPKEYLEIERFLYDNNLIKPEDALFYYDNGFMIIHSNHHYKVGVFSELMETGFNALGNEFLNDFNIGISRMHHFKGDLATAVYESCYAAAFHKEDSTPFLEYGALKTYQAILPYANQSYMQNFAQDFLAPLEKYDSERHSEILTTVITFVECGGDLEEAALRLKQHKNTIRNRLKKAGEILNLNPFALGDYESLAMAVRIHICSGQQFKTMDILL